jgi:phosphatidylserine decarboxylase
MPSTLLYSESPILGIILTISPIIAYYNNYPKLAIALTILLLSMMLFYRHYTHCKRYPNNTIICPADGTVTNLKISDHICYISIFLSPINIHTQVYPVNGTVVKRIYDQTGQFELATDVDKCRDNEKKIHYILTPNLKLLKMTQIAGFLPRRITSSDKVPEEVQAGEYMGMIKFGSRVDLMFPIDNNFQLHIKKGQHVTIGNIIGTE